MTTDLKSRLKNALGHLENAIEDIDDDLGCGLAHAELAQRAIADAMAAHRSAFAEPKTPMEHETERREFAQQSRKKTFEEFVASKIHVANINRMIGVTDEDADGPTPGWVYLPYYENGELLGGCHIEGRNGGEYSLIIANSEWVDHDLSKLERILWDEFAEGETNG